MNIQPNDEMTKILEGEKQPEVISENTPVRLGVMVGIIVFIIGLVTGMGAAIYWGGTVSAKIDQVLAQQSSIIVKNDGMEKDIIAHKTEDMTRWTTIDTRLAIVEKTGSEKTRELEKTLTELQKQFEIHRQKSP